jgi:hypothetical protein
MAALPHYSPGYSGWDVSDQIKLSKLIQQAEGSELPGELSIMDTGMLRPKKSLLGLFGLTRHLDKVRADARLVPCKSCSLSKCQYRRAPYLQARRQIEEVRGLESRRAATVSGLRHDANYSTNLKALRKWSQERLELKERNDGSIEARFRYEGTTCSNMGRPLEFVYEILLGSGREGHKIVEAACRPAPGDAGHALQCEYLKNSELFMNRIDSEKPLLGRPLNDVLAWQRAFSPSGCYCDAGGRAHKWGLVFEVIHYALVRRERELGRP